ncbi:hypothetical protein B0H10DRAFT_2194836 [Mycena sp. CBHHK59/15]|nr:hypothetical protein B0H10DRAFT_2194836 [Mycena sp. CBHHK59/15]
MIGVSASTLSSPFTLSVVERMRSISSCLQLTAKFGAKAYFTRGSRIEQDSLGANTMISRPGTASSETQLCSCIGIKIIFPPAYMADIMSKNCPPWSDHKSFPWSEFASIISKSQDPPFPGLKTYRRTSAHDRFIPLTAVKSTVPINRPNEHPQLLVATANHTFTLVFTSEASRSKWFDAITWPRVPPRNLSTSIKISSDPAANGGFASVYKGTWDDAVKVIRKQGGMDRTKLNKSNERKTKRVENVAKGGCEVVELRPIRSTIARSTGW